MGNEGLRNKLQFGENPEVWALWQLSVVLREIAAADGQTKEDEDIEKEAPPSQTPTGDALTGGGKENGLHE